MDKQIQIERICVSKLEVYLKLKWCFNIFLLNAGQMKLPKLVYNNVRAISEGKENKFHLQLLTVIQIFFLFRNCNSNLDIVGTLVPSHTHEFRKKKIE